MWKESGNRERKRERREEPSTVMIDDLVICEGRCVGTLKKSREREADNLPYVTPFPSNEREIFGLSPSRTSCQVLGVLDVSSAFFMGDA